MKAIGILRLSCLTLLCSVPAFAGEPPALAGEPEAEAGVLETGSVQASLKQGEAAYLARDFDAAVTLFKKAVLGEPQSSMNHYRLGQAQTQKGDLKGAEQSYAQALRFVGDEQGMKLKLLFVLADLKERQKAYDEAGKHWDQYKGFAESAGPKAGYPQTAVDRRKRIRERKKLLAEYAAVRERIEKRLKEADEKARDSAR